MWPVRASPWQRYGPNIWFLKLVEFFDWLLFCKEPIKKLKNIQRNSIIPEFLPGTNRRQRAGETLDSRLNQNKRGILFGSKLSFRFFFFFIVSAEHCLSGHTNISDHFPQMSEDFQKLLNISKRSSKTFRSYRNKFRFVQQVHSTIYDVIDIFT